jgi:hypothetical protein
MTITTNTTNDLSFNKKDEVDMVNHPPHYTSSPATCSCGKPIECIQVTRHMGFNLGNSTKYIWRADLKDNSIEDLEKAVWYLQDELTERKRKAAKK